MARIENPYKCDVCGKAKGEGNLWFIGLVMRIPQDSARLCNWLHCRPSDTVIPGYAIMQWDLALAENAKSHHLCSEQCALTKQAEFIR